MHKIDGRRTAGFWLIELLVVVAIIMIIIGMSIPRLHNAKILALEAAAMKAISTIHVAQAQKPKRLFRQVDRRGPGLRREGRLQVQPFSERVRLYDQLRPDRV
jgi:hypothetical protein